MVHIMICMVSYDIVQSKLCRQTEVAISFTLKRLRRTSKVENLNYSFLSVYQPHS